MTTIKAPFNFVPLSNKVYFPEWAGQISQDVPFSDGLSGIIDLKITAKSPIFVRNGHSKDDGDNKNDRYNSFSKTDDGQYFIPATSLKGAIRNVLEIMSFGKMKVDIRSLFAQREWDNENLYPLRRQQTGFHCGYLKRLGNNYEIIDYGKPYRIGHDRIDEYFKDDIFKNHFSRDSKFDLLHETKIGKDSFDPKTAAFKYELTKNYGLKQLHFDYDDEHNADYNNNRLKVSSVGELEGNIVFTGQPDKWMYPRPTQLTNNAGKFYDFVFVKPEQERKYSITEETFEHFEFIYKDTADWKYAMQELNSTGIPVFFRVQGKNIQNFGLAYLYKLPYDNSPFDLLPDDHKNEEKLDLAECMFGRTSKKESLRGRIQFSNAFSDNAQLDKSYILTLGSPKASYYPIYVAQNGRNNIVAEYATYNDGNISGWKRYVVHHNNSVSGDHQDYAAKLDTILYPLKAESIFNGKIRFHNLKPIELGALLSALTFHNSSNCYHQIGQGKPFGFGKTKIEAKLHGDLENKELDFMTIFEGAMGSSWVCSPSIKELFSMAYDDNVHNQDNILKYMEMSTEKGKNEFINAKNAREYLARYTAISGINKAPVSLYSKYEMEKKAEEEAQAKIKAEAYELEMRKKAEKEAKEAQLNLERKKEEGLSFLNSTYPNDANKYKVNDFNGAKNRINQFLKKMGYDKIPKDQFPELNICIDRCYANANKKDKQQWSIFSSKIWEEIKKWVGEDCADGMFKNLIHS
jgi:CRISPR-associated protein (TIGR03986 family)